MDIMWEDQNELKSTEGKLRRKKANSDLPLGNEGIIYKMIRKGPDRRYDSAEGFLD